MSSCRPSSPSSAERLPEAAARSRASTAASAPTRRDARADGPASRAGPVVAGRNVQDEGALSPWSPCRRRPPRRGSGRPGHDPVAVGRGVEQVGRHRRVHGEAGDVDAQRAAAIASSPWPRGPPRPRRRAEPAGQSFRAHGDRRAADRRRRPVRGGPPRRRLVARRARPPGSARPAGSCARVTRPAGVQGHRAGAARATADQARHRLGGHLGSVEGRRRLGPDSQLGWSPVGSAVGPPAAAAPAGRAGSPGPARRRRPRSSAGEPGPQPASARSSVEGLAGRLRGPSRRAPAGRRRRRGGRRGPAG